MIEYKIQKTLAEISRTKSGARLLTLTSWNGNPAKLDLRYWTDSEDGPQPRKGITLTDAEAQALANALNDYLQGR